MKEVDAFANGGTPENEREQVDAFANGVPPFANVGTAQAGAVLLFMPFSANGFLRLASHPAAVGCAARHLAAIREGPTR